MAVIITQGLELTIESSLGVATAIDCITSLSGFTGEAEDIDVTCLSSTAREYRQGLQDFGDLTIELIRDPRQAGQIVLEEAKNAQAVREFVLTLPSGDVATFDGYVKSLSLSADTGGVVTGTATVKITGDVVWSV